MPKQSHNKKYGGFLPALLSALPMASKIMSKGSPLAGPLANMMGADPLINMGKQLLGNSNITQAVQQQAEAANTEKIKQMAREQEDLIKKDEGLKSKIREQAEEAKELEKELREMKTKVAISERQAALDPKYIGAAAAANAQEYKINAMIASIISIVVSVVIILTYILSVGVTLFSVLNILILAVVAIWHLVNSDNDTIFKDTLKYKLLRYTDMLFNQNISEPYFNIYFINFCLVLVFILFGILFLVFAIAFIIMLIFLYVVPLVHHNFKTDSMDPQQYAKYTFTGVFIGLIFAGIVYSFYRFYFMNVLYPEMSKIKSAIQGIDVLIKDELAKSGNTFNIDLFKILRSKGVGNTNGEYEDFSTFIMNDINAKKYAAAKQKILLITLYSHLYDNIPHTNQKALELVNYYFFKDPDSIDKTLNLKSIDDTSDLTFISLMVENKGVSPISKIYKHEAFYNLNNSKNPDVLKMLKEIDFFMNTVNQKIIQFPDFKNVTDLFAVYMSVSLVICIFAMIIYNFIIKSNSSLYDKSILGIAGGFNKLMVTSIPVVRDIAANLTDSDAYRKCKAIPDKTDRKDCIASIVQ